MRLCERETHIVIVEIPTPYNPEKVKFRNVVLQNWMFNHGIDVPEEEKENYGCKKVVKIDDDEFPKAFMEIYYRSHFSPNKYYWVN